MSFVIDVLLPLSKSAGIWRIKKLSFVVTNSQLHLYIYMPLRHQQPTGHRITWNPFCNALQPQKPKDVLFYGSAGYRILRTTICLVLQATKLQELPFIWLKRSGTLIYTSIQPQKPKDVLLFGSTGHMRCINPIYMVLQATRSQELSFEWL
jgi:hypothetical protein